VVAPDLATHVTSFAPTRRSGRSRCWRDACRREYGDYQTVSWGSVIEARCHGGVYRDRLDLVAELWAYFQ
jgi:hypothetical protein